ncbi:MAG: PKD domain-containing protein [Bacteroidetes bacterium]|nr:MAG: PKD domain-containing protein [Bacteroidota bacterium]
MNTEQINRFDELMREKLSSYEAEPDMDLLPEVHARKNRFLTIRNLQKLIIILALLVAGALGGYFIFNTTNAQHDNKTPMSREAEPASKNKWESATNLHHNLGRKVYLNSGVYGDNGQHKGTIASNYLSVNSPIQTVTKQSVQNKGISVTNTLNHNAQTDKVTDEMPLTLVKTTDTHPTGSTLPTAIDEEQLACDAKFTYYSNYDGTVQFTPIVTATTHTVQYQWNFGDGMKSSKNSPKHTYNKAGHYAVVLTVINKQNGCKAEYAQLVTINKETKYTTTKINGTVFASADYAKHLQVDLLEYNYLNNDYEWVQSTFTNTKGFYEFSEVAAGNYLILTSSYNNYLPTFYGNNVDKNYASTLSIFADDYSELSGYDIQLSSNPYVENARTNIIDTSKTILLVFDENNNPVASIEVSKNGNTQSGNLPDGNYKLVNPSTGESAGDLEVSKGQGKIKMPDASGVGSAGNHGLTQSQLSLVPNPAINSVTVGLSNAENGSIEITIVNNQGAVIKRQIIPSGNQKESIDVSGLSPGNYYVIAKQNGITTTKTMVKSIDNSK